MCGLGRRASGHERRGDPFLFPSASLLYSQAQATPICPVDRQPVYNGCFFLTLPLYRSYGFSRLDDAPRSSLFGRGLWSRSSHVVDQAQSQIDLKELITD